MTADVEAQRARDRAITNIARLLAGRLVPTLDAALVAGHVLDELHALGWRHVPRPQPITAQGKQGDYDRGAAQARRELEAARARIAAHQLKETDR